MAQTESRRLTGLKRRTAARYANITKQGIELRGYSQRCSRWWWWWWWYGSKPSKCPNVAGRLTEMDKILRQRPHAVAGFALAFSDYFIRFKGLSFMSHFEYKMLSGRRSRDASLNEQIPGMKRQQKQEAKIGYNGKNGPSPAQLVSSVSTPARNV